MKIVKDETQADANQQQQSETLHTVVAVVATEPPYSSTTDQIRVVQVNKTLEQSSKVKVDNEVETTDCYKLAVRDGKHILCKVPPSEANVTVVTNAVIEEVKEEDVKASEKREEKSKENKERISKDKDRKKGSTSRSSSRDKERSSSSSTKHKDRDKSSSSSKNKDKSYKDKHRSNGSLKTSSKSSSSSNSSSKDKKENKEKQAEKDKDTLAKIQPQSLNKLGRIPKKASDEKSKDDEKKRLEKKASMGIETKNPNEPRPKTVKVYNSKMRSTGLLEEAKPPPPRTAKKTGTTASPNVPVKRSSPLRETAPQAEKKPKLDIPERPGSIKLIPPKPKRKFIKHFYLLFSFIFQVMEMLSCPWGNGFLK